MARHKTNENPSGKIRLNGEQVIWEVRDQAIVQIDLREIVVIGEYTHSEGPYFDDWFLAFVTKDGSWKHISYYADGVDELKYLLSARLGEDLRSGNLANSTVWKSVILYPNRLKGQVLFQLTPGGSYHEPKSFMDNLLFTLGFGKFDLKQNIDLTNEVKQEIRNAGC